MKNKAAASTRKNRSGMKEVKKKTVLREIDGDMEAGASLDSSEITTPRKNTLKRQDSYEACVQLATEKLGDRIGTDGVLGLTNKKGQNIPTFMVPKWRGIKSDQKGFTTKQWQAVFESFDLHSHLQKQMKRLAGQKTGNEPLHPELKAALDAVVSFNPAEKTTSKLEIYLENCASLNETEYREVAEKSCESPMVTKAMMARISAAVLACSFRLPSLLQVYLLAQTHYQY